MATHEIDHVVAQKHGGRTEAENLALSCMLCNKYKGSDLASVDPATGDLVPLFNPCFQEWADHFRIVQGRFIPLTATGRATVRLLQLNDEGRIAERDLAVAADLVAAPPP
jgi:hypothetical protein